MSFYEYASDTAWKYAGSFMVRDNPSFTGDFADLGRCAKRAAVAAGMTAQRSAKQIFCPPPVVSGSAA